MITCRKWQVLKQQHGFAKGKSTAIAGLLLQSLIVRALDDDQLVLLASLDLSAAFDIGLNTRSGFE